MSPSTLTTTILEWPTEPKTRIALSMEKPGFC